MNFNFKLNHNLDYDTTTNYEYTEAIRYIIRTLNKFEIHRLLRTSQFEDSPKSYVVINLINLMSLIDRLTNPSINIKNNFTKNSVFDETEIMGLHLAVMPSNNYRTVVNYLHNKEYLKTAEETFKKKEEHFIRILTAGNTKRALYIFSDDTPTPEELIKLKLLQLAVYETSGNLALNSKTKEFYTALLNKDKETVEAIITEILNSETLVNEQLDKIKRSFKSNKENQIKNLLDNIERTRDMIDSYRQELNRSLNNLNEYNEKYEFLLSKPDETPYETIYKYLQKSPYIKRIIMNDSILELIYEAPLLYYDDYLIEKIMHNKTEGEQKILRLFLEHEYECVVKSKISFDTRTFRVDTYQISDNNLYSHPHLSEYHCFGNHVELIANTTGTSDYIDTLDQITACVLNLNFSDSVVVNTFLQRMFETRYKKSWKDKKTGEMLSLDQILYMKENQNEETQNK